MDISTNDENSIDNDERLARLALYLALNHNSGAFYRVLNGVGTALEAFEGHDLRNIGLNLTPLLRMGAFDEALSQIDYAKKYGLDIIIVGDDDYPLRLNEVPNPAPVLWRKGSIETQDQFAVALVGSRSPSVEALNAARSLGRDGAARGLTIVSGLAKGIDGAAHRGALEAQGRTIAVLGCGLGHIYPKENADLFEQIPKAGALLSEFPPQVSPLPAFFPRRNRVIASLSLAVVVVEAGERSGALITARLGLEINREVMAMPGPAGSQKSRGCNSLIKKGAALVENIDEVIYEIKPRLLEGLHHCEGGAPPEDGEPQPKLDQKPNDRNGDPPLGLSDEALKLWMELSQTGSLDVDSLMRATKLSAGETAIHLLNMELEGLIMKNPSGCYVLVK